MGAPNEIHYVNFIFMMECQNTRPQGGHLQMAHFGMLDVELENASQDSCNYRHL